MSSWKPLIYKLLLIEQWLKWNLICSFFIILQVLKLFCEDYWTKDLNSELIYFGFNGLSWTNKSIIPSFLTVLCDIVYILFSFDIPAYNMGKTNYSRRKILNSDQIEELEYEEDFDVTEQLRKLDLELENDGEASELLNLGSFRSSQLIDL